LAGREVVDIDFFDPRPGDIMHSAASIDLDV
jgi:hypothetical protein